MKGKSLPKATVEESTSQVSQTEVENLRESVQKAFNWILHEAPGTGSAWDLARIILWLYNWSAFPNSRGLNACDNTRAQWAVDLIQYYVTTRMEPQQWFEDGHELLSAIKKQYGNR